MYASISFKIVRQFFPVAAGIKEMFFYEYSAGIRPFWKYDIRQETVTKKPSPDIRSKYRHVSSQGQVSEPKPPGAD